MQEVKSRRFGVDALMCKRPLGRGSGGWVGNGGTPVDGDAKLLFFLYIYIKYP